MDFEALVRKLEMEASSLRERIAVSRQRLTEIETFLQLGQKLAGRANTGPTVDEMLGAISASAIGSKQRDRVLGVAQQLLSDGERRTTRDLLAEMSKFGVLPGGANPALNLSTYLSRDSRFVSDTKRGGWTLASLVPLPSNQGSLRLNTVIRVDREEAVRNMPAGLITSHINHEKEDK
jgi:hypothetical protein